MDKREKKCKLPYYMFLIPNKKEKKYYEKNEILHIISIISNFIGCMYQQQSK